MFDTVRMFASWALTALWPASETNKFAKWNGCTSQVCMVGRDQVAPMAQGNPVKPATRTSLALRLAN